MNKPSTPTRPEALNAQAALFRTASAICAERADNHLADVLAAYAQVLDADAVRAERAPERA